MPAPLREDFPQEAGREQAPPVSFPWARTWPDHKSPRLSAPGSRAGSRTTLNESCSASILPLQKSSVILAAAGTPEAALHASLSGSGSALFGLYLTRGDAEAACERLRAMGVKSFLTRTLPRDEYWGEMLLQSELTVRPLCERDSRRLPEASTRDRTLTWGASQCWAIV